MYNYTKFSEAPDIVRQLSIVFDGFIVGGSAKYLLDIVDFCNDWDIIIPLSQWGKAQKLIPKTAIHNTFGGSKIIYDKTQVDVWSCDLSEYLIANSQKEVFIVHPHSLFYGNLTYGFKK